MHMRVRRATKTDIQSIVENNILLAKESEGETLNQDIAEQGVINLFSHPEKGFYLVAEDNNKIIGQLMITFEWSDWRNTDIWWIQSVYIHKEHRKIGVFTALFDMVSKQAQQEGVPLLRLYVHKHNTTAQYVYQKRGMTKGTYIFYEIPVKQNE